MNVIADINRFHVSFFFKTLLNGVFLLAVGLFFTPAYAKDHTELSLRTFIELASKNDGNFEAILLDQLPLQYRRAALLPDSDLLVSLKQLFYFYLDEDHSNADTTVSLGKLFPNSGTDLSLSYNKPATITSDDNASLQLLVSQPIAKNAFGKGFQLLDKIVGIENEIIRHQIIEAYEDYLASLTVAYYNWYSAYENLKVGEASLKSSQKLLDNILERKRQKIALPIDVNKMKLSLVGKKENLVILEEIFNSHSNLIFKAIRNQGDQTYIPTKPEALAGDIEFEQFYREFTENSRTYTILNLLEQQGTLEVKKAADDLLPSTNLIVGYELQGRDWGASDQNNGLFAGISFSTPIGRSVSKARYEITQIERKRTLLANQNKYEDLRTNLMNLYSQIQREQKLVRISEDKIKLAEAILKDEAENYSFGKVSLNDYIDAVNNADANRFSYTAHSVELNILLVEWQRLTDKLVDERTVLETGLDRKP